MVKAEQTRLKQVAAEVAAQVANPTATQLLMRMVGHVNAITQLWDQASAINDNAALPIDARQVQLLHDMVIYYSAVRGFDEGRVRAHLHAEFAVSDIADLMQYQYTDAVSYLLTMK